MTGHRRLVHVVLTTVTLAAVVESTAGARNVVAEVQALYEAASFEEALALLDGTEAAAGGGEGAAKETGQLLRRYKALCLMALGRHADAARAVEEMVRADPLARGDDRDLPPGLRAAIHQTRVRIAPDVVRERYRRGRKGVDNGSLSEAAADFRTVVALFADERLGLSSNPVLADLRLVSQGFLDLISTAPAAVAPPSGAPLPEMPAASRPSGNSSSSVVPSAAGVPARGGMTAPANAAPAGGAAPDRPATPGISASSEAAPGVVPPVAITQRLPDFPSDSRRFVTRPLIGIVKVRIGADGRVTAAAMVVPIHRDYDSRLLNAAKTWKYEPARQNGAAVVYDKLIRVVVSNQAPPSAPPHSR